MFANFTSSSNRRFPSTVKNLKEICKTACSIEELILFWCGLKRIVTIAPVLTEDSIHIEFRFMFKNKIMGVARTPLAVLLEQVPLAEPIDDTILFFDDQSGGRPNEPWYEERSARLGIVFDKIVGINKSPAQAIGELIISYLLVGSVVIECGGVALDGRGKAEAIHIRLTYMTGHPVVPGWREEVYVPRGELVQHISANRRQVEEIH